MRVHEVFRSQSVFRLPEGSAEPRADQFRGSDLDKLCELAGRVCYDSIGTGRSSEDYHKHIRDVGHTNVLEHARLVFTVEYGWVSARYETIMACLISRPGVVVTDILGEGNTNQIRFVANLRAIREWDRWSAKYGRSTDRVFIDCCNRFGTSLIHAAKSKAPLVLSDLQPVLSDSNEFSIKVAEPISDNERYVSMLFRDVSRALSHELVRHRWETAVSQRSTRYVTEEKTKWVWHPVLVEWLASKNLTVEETLGDFQSQSRELYTFLMDQIEADLKEKNGGDKLTARKQARGAARGVLGHALSTELLMTASIDQWREMIRQRHNPAADREINDVFIEVEAVLDSRSDRSIIPINEPAIQ